MECSNDDEIASEERGIYAVIALAGIPTIIAFLIDGGVLGGGGTISLVAVVLGVFGFGVTLRRRRRLPKARVLVSGSRHLPR